MGPIQLRPLFLATLCWISFIGSTVRAQDNDNAPDISVLSGGTRGSLDDGGVISVREPRPHIDCAPVTQPEHPHTPFITDRPITITRFGIKLGFDGPPPQQGHSNTIMVQPLYNRPTVSPLTIVITGPHQYRVDLPVNMPREDMENCTPLPDYPDSCRGVFAHTRHHPIEVNTPPLPHTGTYSIRVESSPNGPRGPTRQFEVNVNPLAAHISLPNDFVETSRQSHYLKVIDQDTVHYNGEALRVCGKKRLSEICVSTTEVMNDCDETLHANNPVVQTSVLRRQREYVNVKRPPQTTQWCHEGRLMTAEVFSLWRHTQDIMRLQSVLPPHTTAADASVPQP